MVTIEADTGSFGRSKSTQPTVCRLSRRKPCHGLSASSLSALSKAIGAIHVRRTCTGHAPTSYHDHATNLPLASRIGFSTARSRPAAPSPDESLPLFIRRWPTAHLHLNCIQGRSMLIMQREGNPMPQWLCNQLQRAFKSKDLRQIRVLNDCWFFYRASAESRRADNNTAKLDERL